MHYISGIRLDYRNYIFAAASRVDIASRLGYAWTISFRVISFDDCQIIHDQHFSALPRRTILKCHHFAARRRRLARTVVTQRASLLAATARFHGRRIRGDIDGLYRLPAQRYHFYAMVTPTLCCCCWLIRIVGESFAAVDAAIRY